MSATFWNMRRRKAAAKKAQLVEKHVENVENQAEKPKKRVKKNESDKPAD